MKKNLNYFEEHINITKEFLETQNLENYKEDVLIKVFINKKKWDKAFEILFSNDFADLFSIPDDFDKETDIHPKTFELIGILNALKFYPNDGIKKRLEKFGIKTDYFIHIEEIKKTIEQINGRNIIKIDFKKAILIINHYLTSKIFSETLVNQNYLTKKTSNKKVENNTLHSIYNKRVDKINNKKKKNLTKEIALNSDLLKKLLPHFSNFTEKSFSGKNRTLLKPLVEIIEFNLKTNKAKVDRYFELQPLLVKLIHDIKTQEEYDKEGIDLPHKYKYYFLSFIQNLLNTKTSRKKKTVKFKTQDNKNILIS
jgi:hypothetical protein